MTVKFKLDSRVVPEGTVLLFGIRYVGPDQEGIARMPEEEAKVYTYAMIKAGGFWYVTGGGRTPQVAGWGAVERWLERDGREVAWVKAVTETVTLWPTPVSKVAGSWGDKIPDGPGPDRDAWLKVRGWGSFEEWQNRDEGPEESGQPARVPA
jgi:hypothetical protein